MFFNEKIFLFDQNIRSGIWLLFQDNQIFLGGENIFFEVKYYIVLQRFAGNTSGSVDSL